MTQALPTQALPTHAWVDDIVVPQVIIMAIFGHDNQLTESALYEQVLYPLLEEWGRTPDRILLPSEGKTSADLHDWAESVHRTAVVFHPDWTRNGRIAQILRDDRMMKECTHALFFLTGKSKKREAYSEKWTRKGKQVFTWSTDHGLSHLETIPDPPKASTPARKSDKGTMRMWLKCQTKE